MPIVSRIKPFSNGVGITFWLKPSSSQTGEAFFPKNISLVFSKFQQSNFTIKLNKVAV